MVKEVIQLNRDTYSLNMNKKENKSKTEEENIVVEYGEQDLKETLLKLIKIEYIKKCKKDKDTSPQKESNLKP